MQLKSYHAGIDTTAQISIGRARGLTVASAARLIAPIGIVRADVKAQSHVRVEHHPSAPVPLVRDPSDAKVPEVVLLLVPRVVDHVIVISVVKDRLIVHPGAIVAAVGGVSPAQGMGTHQGHHVTHCEAKLVDRPVHHVVVALLTVGKPALVELAGSGIDTAPSKRDVCDGASWGSLDDGGIGREGPEVCARDAVAPLDVEILDAGDDLGDATIVRLVKENAAIRAAIELGLAPGASVVEREADEPPDDVSAVLVLEEAAPVPAASIASGAVIIIVIAVAVAPVVCWD